MSAPPSLFDAPAIARNRARATDHGLFLHEAAREMVEDRLSIVNRTFTDVAIVSPFPQIWSGFEPAARVIADTETLDLDPNSVDLVIHAMCMHWASDPVGQLIQCRRALRADGLCIAMLLGGSTLSDLRNVLRDSEAHLTGGLSPRVCPMADIRELGALLQRAGFALPVADSDTLTAEYRDLWHLMHDLRQMGEGNAMRDRSKFFSRRSIFDHAARIYTDRHATAKGRLPARFETITLTGWAPSESQPKPLRPGSATSRLADALKTDEFNLPD